MTEGWDGEDAGRKLAKAVLFGFLPLALAATGVFFWATAPSNGGGEEVVADILQPSAVDSAPVTGSSQPEVVEAAESVAQTPSGQGPTQGSPAVNARRVASAQPSQSPAQQQGSDPAAGADATPNTPAPGSAPDAAPQQMAAAETQQSTNATPGAGPANNPATPPAMPPAPPGTGANVLFGAAAGGFAIAAVVTAAKENDGGNPFSP